ncbi:Scr1 family TA system antitoxin-like transcriptional regulator [Actinomadura sp. 9N215]|uniref:helix-turn-helix domain-containing protein n=1 Tax=Actinomadura sp. 9N215 TaxID=3375150 RepID=UPI0037A0EDCF
MITRNNRSPRKFLGREIQQAREAKGMTRDDLAKEVPVSESLVKSWENGTRLPKPDTLRTVERLLGFGDGKDPGILCRIREDLINDAVPLEWFGKWQKVEEQATELWSFECFVIPGLLQTEEYATAVLHASHHNADPEEETATRLERQKILDEEEDPPTLVALIAEAALRNNMGGKKVMHEQLLHLAEMARRENIIVQIIPADSEVCAGFTGPFVIANFDGGEVAYVDNAISGDVIEDGQEVARLRRMFNIFRSDALRAQDSIDFITRLAHELWT